MKKNKKKSEDTELDATIRDLSKVLAEDLMESLNHAISWAITDTVINELPGDEWITAINRLFDATINEISCK